MKMGIYMQASCVLIKIYVKFVLTGQSSVYDQIDGLVDIWVQVMSEHWRGDDPLLGPMLP